MVENEVSKGNLNVSMEGCGRESLNGIRNNSKRIDNSTTKTQTPPTEPPTK